MKFKKILQLNELLDYLTLKLSLNAWDCEFKNYFIKEKYQKITLVCKLQNEGMLKINIINTYNEIIEIEFWKKELNKESIGLKMISNFDVFIDDIGSLIKNYYEDFKIY